MIALDSWFCSVIVAVLLGNRVDVLCIECDGDDRFVIPNVEEESRDWLLAQTPSEVANSDDSAKANNAVTLKNRYRKRLWIEADLAVRRDIIEGRPDYFLTPNYCDNPTGIR